MKARRRSVHSIRCGARDSGCCSSWRRRWLSQAAHRPASAPAWSRRRSARGPSAASCGCACTSRRATRRAASATRSSTSCTGCPPRRRATAAPTSSATRSTGPGRPAILVAPQGARDHDSDPEYLDWGPDRNWQTAVGQELPRFFDRHFRTIPNRHGRALVGLSAGGYGATLLALHHLEAFSVVEPWSGYFHPTNPAGTARLDLGSRAANARASAHTYVRTLRRAFRRRPTFFAFYVGRGDTRFRAENLRLHRELLAAGVPHLFRQYPGAHAQTVWSAHATAWLRLTLDHLSA